MSANGKNGIEVRPCSTLADFQECVRIQRTVWGTETSNPLPLFVAVYHAGGQVLGAFENSEMLGFTLAFVGLRKLPTRSGSAQHVETPILHSHMTAVLPEFRDCGVGGRLKLFQREDALKRGIGLVEWTFDPIELKNAHFNLVRLGAIVRRFLPNCYGITESPLHSGIPTDRLLAEWWLASERVESILSGDPPPAAADAQIVSVPADIGECKSADRDAALRIQSEVRTKFQELLARGYAATSVAKRGAAVDYVFQPADKIAGLRLPALALHEG